MPEPFKNFFSKELIVNMADQFARQWSAFDQDGFVTFATDDLESLELKERSDRVFRALETFFPEDFEHSVSILLASLAPENDDESGGLKGWAIMPMTHYVGVQGLQHFESAMNVQKELTKRFTAEFGVRFLILDNADRAMATMQEWTQDEDHHVRRLASEGSRPRLPWAMQLPDFIADPTPLIPVLESLKDDESEYVRRSVANNLNDIAKDHPNLVAEIANRWMKNASPERQKLVRHACRTLIKQGHKKTLKALGYGPPKVKLAHLKVLTPTVQFGHKLEFEISLESTSPLKQPLVIDYVIHHRKANGSTSPKVFKWKTLLLQGNATIIAARKHAIRKITTRTYYAGTHSLEMLINGVHMGQCDFELAIDSLI